MLIQILLIGVSVSMDAFAVSIGKGLTVKKLRSLDALKTALWFGGFQALFPLLGYFAASTFSKYVTAVDHWIIFGLLALIGGNMVREAFMTLNIWLSVIIIGVTTGLFSAAGLYIGRAFGSRWQKPAQIAGGIVLILIGVKVLFEHLGFLG